MRITTIPLDPNELPQTVIFEDAFLTRYVPPRISVVPCPWPPREEVRFAFGRAVRIGPGRG